MNHYCPNGHAGVAVREELQVAVLQALASLVVDPSPVGDLIPRFDLATDAGARYPNLIALTLYRDWPQLVQGGLFSCRTLSWREHNTTLLVHRESSVGLAFVKPFLGCDSIPIYDWPAWTTSTCPSRAIALHFSQAVIDLGRHSSNQ